MSKNLILQVLKNFEGKYFDTSISAAGRFLNYKLEKVEQGYIEASMLVRDEMTNPSKNLHGGMFAMLMDEISGVAYYSLGLTTYYTTLNLSIDYLYSAALGEIVLAKARVIRSGKKIGNIRCEVFNEKGDLLAQSTTNLINTQQDIFDLSRKLNA